MRMIVALVVLGLPAPALAQMSESEARNACMGDALKLCLSAVPDRDRIVACLQSRRAEVSPACRTALDGGSARPARRG